MKSLVVIVALFIQAPPLFGDAPIVKGSVSPNGRYCVVMDIDRDPTIKPEYKGDSYPQIEVTEIKTGKVVSSLSYFGSIADDARPLRDHISVLWRKDSTALAINILDRFYSASQVLAMDTRGVYIPVPFPTYTQMTGFPVPDRKNLRPRGWCRVVGWNKDGNMIYTISYSPEPFYRGRDPLKHRVLLKVSAAGMSPVKQVEE